MQKLLNVCDEKQAPGWLNMKMSQCTQSTKKKVFFFFFSSLSWACGAMARNIKETGCIIGLLVAGFWCG